MQKPGKFIVVSAALTILIGLGAYLGHRHAPPSGQLQNLSSVTQNTNRPSLHSHRASTAESETSDGGDKSGSSKFSREKVEEYLRRHNRDVGSLLAAFHALGDTNYLNEAATNFPSNPRLQWTILARDAFPEDRRKWLDMFKASSPSNSLANYLSARDYFKNNQPDAAMKELLAASDKSQFSDYSMESILGGEDLGRFGGSSAMETRSASMEGMASDLLPELSNIKGLAVAIRDIQQQYVNSGDTASAQNLAEMGMNLANRFGSGDDGKFIISQLVSMASMAVVLESLDQNASYDFLDGETPTQRLADLKQQKASISKLAKIWKAAYPTMSEEEMADYWERAKIYGELPAMQWFQQQNASTPNTGN